MEKEEEYVQYIVVRKDLLEQMGRGKLAAQCCHGSLAVLLDKSNGEVKLDNSDNVNKWVNSRFVKLVCYIKNKYQMLKLKNELDELQIKNVAIFDACRTSLEPEEENGSTLTVLGIVPICRNNVPKCLKKLQLLD